MVLLCRTQLAVPEDSQSLLQHCRSMVTISIHAVRVFLTSTSFSRIFIAMQIQLSCTFVCVFSSHSFWTSSSLDVPAGVTQEEGHTAPCQRRLTFYFLINYYNDSRDVKQHETSHKGSTGFKFSPVETAEAHRSKDYYEHHLK